MRGGPRSCDSNRGRARSTKMNRGRAKRTKVVRGGPWSRDSAVVVGPKLLGLVFLGFHLDFTFVWVPRLLVPDSSPPSAWGRRVLPQVLEVEAVIARLCYVCRKYRCTAEYSLVIDLYSCPSKCWKSVAKLLPQSPCLLPAPCFLPLAVCRRGASDLQSRSRFPQETCCVEVLLINLLS